MGAWDKEVLDFWFGELTPEQWFGAKAETDAAIRERFETLHGTLQGALPEEALVEPRPALAATIVLDQFPRNIYRRKAAAFASDAQAMRVAKNAVETGLDTGMNARERQFLYMPFMHSEVLADQERGVMLFHALGDEEALKYAVEHRDIIARFGRFPHRNRALGRVSTADETAFLEGHGGYGQ